MPVDQSSSVRANSRVAIGPIYSIKMSLQNNQTPVRFAQSASVGILVPRAFTCHGCRPDLASLACCFSSRLGRRMLRRRMLPTVYVETCSTSWMLSVGSWAVLSTGSFAINKRLCSYFPLTSTTSYEAVTLLAASTAEPLSR